MNRLKLFLKELAELTQKYGFVIGGCGCCGSPYIDDLKRETIDDITDLGYKRDKKVYSVIIDYKEIEGGDMQ